MGFLEGVGRGIAKLFINIKESSDKIKKYKIEYRHKSKDELISLLDSFGNSGEDFYKKAAIKIILKEHGVEI